MWPVGSRQSAFTPSTANTFFIISENTDRIDCLYEGVCENVGPVVNGIVIITDIIYIMLINMLVDLHHFFCFIL